MAHFLLWYSSKWVFQLSNCWECLFNPQSLIHEYYASLPICHLTSPGCLVLVSTHIYIEGSPTACGKSSIYPYTYDKELAISTSLLSSSPPLCHHTYISLRITYSPCPMHRSYCVQKYFVIRLCNHISTFTTKPYQSVSRSVMQLLLHTSHQISMTINQVVDTKLTMQWNHQQPDVLHWRKN